MKINKIYLFLSLGIFLVSSFNTVIQAEDLFILNDLQTAKSRAAQEKKYILIDFTASWCAPCRWMEETTWSQPDLQEYLEKKWISVKADVENLDGFELMQKYKVTILPTILIVDAQGKVIRKFEKSMGATALQASLRSCEPKDEAIAMKETAPVRTAPLPPVIKPTQEERMIPARMNIRSDGYQEKKQEKASVNSTAQPWNTPMTVSWQWSNVKSTGWTIQCGTYLQYDNAMEHCIRMQQSQEQPIYIQSVETGGVMAFKLCIGSFATVNAAKEFLAKSKMEGFARKL